MPKKPKGLLLSAYDAGSHRYWRKGLESGLEEFDWTVLTLPARFFSWRIRGNPISFLEQYSAELNDDYDFIVATSMVDLATLKGVIPSLANTPSLLYYHENQFEYPKSVKQQASIDPQMVNLYSALAADLIVFNTDFNRRTFFTGCDQLMAKLPDYVMTDLSARLMKKSSVIPVPIDDALFELPGSKTGKREEPVKLIWNHRWEYDKGPDRLLLLLNELEKRAVLFELSIVGEAFRNVPGEFKQIKERFSKQLNVFGYVNSLQEYRALLGRCDVVLSTSIHEFQGISVMEGISAGCLPLVPDRLSYRELIPEEYRYCSNLESPQQEANSAVEKLLGFISVKDDRLRQDFQRYSWHSLLNLYRRKISQLLS